MEIFRERVGMILVEINTNVSKFQNQPENPLLFDRIFGGFYTIKVAAAMCGFIEISSFSNQVANIIALVRKGKIGLPSDFEALVLAACKQIAALIDHKDEGKRELISESERIINSLANLNNIMDCLGANGRQSIANKPKVNNHNFVLSRKRAGRLRFLIVDDEISSRIILQDILSDFGTIHIASDGNEAILAYKRSRIEQRPYDVILLDILMPGLDGREVAREIRRFDSALNKDRACKIFMTSSLDDKTFIDDMLRERVCDVYMVKPIMKKMIQEHFAGNEMVH